MWLHLLIKLWKGVYLVSYIYPTWNICMCYLEEADNHPFMPPLMVVDWVDFHVNLKVKERLSLELQVKTGIPLLNSNEIHNTSTPDFFFFEQDLHLICNVWSHPLYTSHLLLVQYCCLLRYKLSLSGHAGGIRKITSKFHWNQEHTYSLFLMDEAIISICGTCSSFTTASSWTTNPRNKSNALKFWSSGNNTMQMVPSNDLEPQIQGTGNLSIPDTQSVHS